MTKPDPLTGPLVRFARGVRYTDLTPSTVHAIVRNLLDTVGAVPRPGSAPRRPPRRAGWPARPVGRYVASAFGLPEPVQADAAIFANAAAVRNRDWHDGGIKAGDPSDVTSAVLATAEATGASVERVIEAIFATYEIVGALGQDDQFAGKGVRTLIATFAAVVGVGHAAGADRRPAGPGRRHQRRAERTAGDRQPDPPVPLEVAWRGARLDDRLDGGPAGQVRPRLGRPTCSGPATCCSKRSRASSTWTTWAR